MKRHLALRILLTCFAAATLADEYEYNPAIEITPAQLEELVAYAEAGNAYAAFELFTRYKNGKGVEKDLAMGAKWAHEYEQYDTGTMDTNINTPETLANLKTRAMAGDERTAYELAWRYEDGTGALIEKDQTEAAKWYQMAADGDHNDSMMWIGRAYRDGRGGFQKDHAAALKWFTQIFSKTADTKIHRCARLSAALEISGLYRHGDSTLPANEVKAGEWLGKIEYLAHENKVGYYQVRHDLAVAYHDGQLIPMDRVRALQLFTQVALQNNSRSMMRTAAAHYAGYGTLVDKALAREWLTKLKRIHDSDWSRDFATVAGGTNKAAAKEWYLEKLSVADELRRQYEQAYFLETAKGKREEAFVLYRQIIATKATHGTHFVIAKILEHMLTYYSEPANDPAQVSYKFAREFLALCREHEYSPGVFGMPEAFETMKNVIGLQALNELCQLNRDRKEELLKSKDVAYRKAAAACAAGEIDDTELAKRRRPVWSRLCRENKAFQKVADDFERYVSVRNTRVLEYLIDDYEKRGVPFPSEWIIRERDYLLRAATERESKVKVEGGSK